MSRETLKPMARAILARVNEARAEHLRATQEDFGWAEIGRRMGWVQGTLSAVRNGLRPVHLEEVPQLAAVLGVRLVWLFTGEGPMWAPAPPAISELEGPATGYRPPVVAPGYGGRPVPRQDDQEDRPRRVAEGGARGAPSGHRGAAASQDASPRGKGRR